MDMRIGVARLADGPVAELVGWARAAAAAGLDGAFLGQHLGGDAVLAAAVVGREVPGIEVGTAVVPTPPRHPRVLAGQALTAQEVTGGRFALGVGPGHGPVMEEVFGVAAEPPARHTRAYLTALRTLLRDAPPGVTPPPVLVGALGPAMLRVAGELADGVVTTWTGVAAVAGHVVPRVGRAAREAGRPAPRVLVGVLMALTGDPEGARDDLAARLGPAGDLPAYRAALDRQGLSGVHETVVAGDEREIERRVRAFADAGATDLLVSGLGDPAAQGRLLEVLGALRGR
ncbi:LLM class flavin-dependent oxidoreductase [Actinomadura kijaniata]|uniref:LLM class flavin-dependent oxidoreductase n=1 Tax=Actinomadura kijaniata TaxID=46161 RepID=UPI000AE30FA1|nr:LLM class flavin-dependent oxidoreductase [Actinomadura kijaniata]